MSWISLYNVPEAETAFATFSFENARHHEVIASWIVAQGGQGSPGYVLDPLPNFALNEWLIRHQAVHNVMNAALGLLGNDLTVVDFKNKEQLASWIELHAGEHRSAAQVSGAG